MNPAPRAKPDRGIVKLMEAKASEQGQRRRVSDDHVYRSLIACAASVAGFRVAPAGPTEMKADRSGAEFLVKKPSQVYA